MARWHTAALGAFVGRAQLDPDARGVVLVGSLARGDDRPDSDVDLYLIVSDAAFDRAAEAGRISFVDRTGVDDPHGYVDVKLASPGYLRDAADAGDDPLRASLVGARVLWDGSGELAAAIRAILHPEPGYFPALETAFADQIALHGSYFLPQALARGNRLLAAHAAVHVAYAAGRLILAHDRAFFRGAKYLDAQLATSPSAPSELTRLLAEFVARPSEPLMRTLEDTLRPVVPGGFRITDEVLSRFITDNELSWRTRTPPPEFR